MGIEITDSEIRLVQIKETGLDKIKKEAISLPPGVVFNGKIQDSSSFLSTLKKLHHRVSATGRKIDVVVTALASQVSVSVISAPDSINFNLENLLPFDPDEYYYLVIPYADSNQYKKEFLVAWADKKLVDELKKSLEEANFSVVDFEFPPISLMRSIKEIGGNDEKIISLITPDGTMFSKLSAGNLRDFKFCPLGEELHSFDTSGAEIVDLNKHALSKWLVAIGAATKLQNLLLINKSRTNLFRIISRSLLFVLMLFLVFDLIFSGISLALRNVAKKASSVEDISQVAGLKNKLKEFNILSNLALQAKDTTISAILKKLQQLSAYHVTLNRILIDGNRNVVINGNAASESAIVKFKDKLIEFEGFKDVVLPLSSLETEENGEVLFSLSFKTKMNNE